MNILYVIIFLFVNSLNVDSWGPTGHRDVGEIAAQNISEKTREEISKILDGQTLAYVSTFADEIKSDDRYDINLFYSLAATCNAPDVETPVDTYFLPHCYSRGTIQK